MEGAKSALTITARTFASEASACNCACPRGNPWLFQRLCGWPAVANHGPHSKQRFDCEGSSRVAGIVCFMSLREIEE